MYIACNELYNSSLHAPNQAKNGPPMESVKPLNSLWYAKCS